MSQIEIRQGTAEDASLIAHLTREMVIEMENYGGDAVNPSPEIWAAVEANVIANTTSREYLYLLATRALPAPIVVGMAAANIEKLETIFIPRTRLHISAIYTIPSARRRGVARQLIENILKWGQHMEATEVDLNVLIANPARQLYERLGFQPHEISMVKKTIMGAASREPLDS